MKCGNQELAQMYQSKSLDAEILLKWSKLLAYDFFRIYSQHLVLYSPPSSSEFYQKAKDDKKAQLPEFRKNIYTVEMIEFILTLLKTNEKTKKTNNRRIQNPKNYFIQMD
ncbi:transposase [Chryseobacterium sp. 'Rf worker isolate 10']|uniref:transposase n=1 Tax=Chryseobacterium sp. 'Rf worker isolate 10' TaxID=2887348 RepID=UPI003D6F07F7